MAKIMLDANPDDAPGCIKIINMETGEDILVQTDWDWPGVARNFGWNMTRVRKKGRLLCHHVSTDGTIDCRECGVTAEEFISAAREWIDRNDGKEIEDPGYW